MSERNRRIVLTVSNHQIQLREWMPRDQAHEATIFMLIIVVEVVDEKKTVSEWDEGEREGLTWQSLKLELLVIIISLLYIDDHRSIDSNNSSWVIKYNGIKGKINKWEATCKSSHDSSYRLNRPITNTSH